MFLFQDFICWTVQWMTVLLITTLKKRIVHARTNFLWKTTVQFEEVRHKEEEESALLIEFVDDWDEFEERTIGCTTFTSLGRTSCANCTQEMDIEWKYLVSDRPSVAVRVWRRCNCRSNPDGGGQIIQSSGEGRQLRSDRGDTHWYRVKGVEGTKCNFNSTEKSVLRKVLAFQLCSHSNYSLV